VAMTKRRPGAVHAAFRHEPDAKVTGRRWNHGACETDLSRGEGLEEGRCSANRRVPPDVGAREPQSDRGRCGESGSQAPEHERSDQRSRYEQPTASVAHASSYPRHPPREAPRPTVQLRRPLVGVEARPPRARFQLAVLPDLHTETPRGLADAQTEALALVDLRKRLVHSTSHR